MKLKRAAKSTPGLGTLYEPHEDPPRTTTALVECTGDQVRVLRCGPGLPMADDPPARGVAFGSLVGVLHQLDLPPADAATTPRLIEAQLETLIPGQAEHVCWGWQRASADGPVLVYTAARRRLDALLSRAEFAVPPSAIGNPALALHQAFSTCGEAEGLRDTAVVARQAGRCHLLCYRDGKLKVVDTLGTSGAAFEASGEVLATAVKQALETPASGADGPPSYPSTFTLIGDGSPSAESVSAFEKILGIPHRRVEGLLTLPGLDRFTADHLVAVGTAIAAAKPGRAINLAAVEETPTDGSAYRPTRGRWIAAAGLLIAALVFLYVSDSRKAETLAAAVEASGVQARDLTVLNTDLAVARYLEGSGPGFLAVLDEFGHRTEGFMVDEMRFERDGTFTIRATARSANEVNRLAAKLADMKTLTSVRVRNQVAKDRDKIEYTLIAQPSPRFFEAFAPPVPGKSADSEKPRNGGDA